MILGKSYVCISSDRRATKSSGAKITYVGDPAAWRLELVADVVMKLSEDSDHWKMS
jgi:hypothetical protein